MKLPGIAIRPRGKQSVSLPYRSILGSQYGAFRIRANTVLSDSLSNRAFSFTDTQTCGFALYPILSIQKNKKRLMTLLQYIV